MKVIGKFDELCFHRQRYFVAHLLGIISRRNNKGAREL